MARTQQPDRVQLDRVVIENFRSIKHCDVSLGSDLIFLVGRNGSGKSSFLDALKFISATLTSGLAAALAGRNGLSTILYKPSSFPAQIKFRLWFSVLGGRSGWFEITIAAGSWTECSVVSEKCQVGDGAQRAEYSVTESGVSGNVATLPPAPSDRLYLSAVSGFAEFREVYRLLAQLSFSEYAPRGIHLLRSNSFPKAYGFPGRVGRLLNDNDGRRNIVEAYMRLIVPGFIRFEVESVDGRDSVAFVERIDDSENKFYLSQISDGTLYAAEILLDLFLRDTNEGQRLPILVEEPGGTLHPWAADILRSALKEAAEERQVIVTTHSPELIDDASIPPANIRVTYRNGSGTQIEPLGAAAMTLLENLACTAGDLFRRGALSSDQEPEFVPFIA